MTLYNHFASKEDLIVAALAFKQARLALLRELCREMGVKHADTLAWQIAMQMEGAIVVAFMHALDAAGVAYTDLRTAQSSLEDIFVSLVHEEAA